jgi:hypothetical protein
MKIKTLISVTLKYMLLIVILAILNHLKYGGLYKDSKFD